MTAPPRLHLAQASTPILTLERRSRHPAVEIRLPSPERPGPLLDGRDPARG